MFYIFDSENSFIHNHQTAECDYDTMFKHHSIPVQYAVGWTGKEMIPRLFEIICCAFHQRLLLLSFVLFFSFRSYENTIHTKFLPCAI